MRVLVADDDPIVRDVIATHLRDLESIPVEAENGAEAWRLLGEQSFDLVIVDLAMPEVDGFQLISRMRCQLAMQHVPILVVTSREDKDAVRDAFHAGASSFLTKPIDWPTFEHHLAFLLRLSSFGRRERNRAQQNMAVSRAREAILGKICQSVAACAGVLEDTAAEIERLDTTAGRGRSARRQVEAILTETRALQMMTRRVAELTDNLASEVLVEDRRETIVDIFSEAIAGVQDLADEAEVSIGFDLPRCQISVFCSGESIVLALVQLLRNAISYSPPGGKVWIAARLLPDGVMAITVSDDGVGMDPEFVASCLNPLQSHRRGVVVAGMTATGFGLPLAKAIAEAHSGSLEVHSMTGQGTDALFVLPAERVIRVGFEESIDDESCVSGQDEVDPDSDGETGEPPSQKS